MISLINDTINQSDLKSLAEWLLDNPRLTKGKLTLKFEKEWSKFTGCRYSVYVNSGSSANLLMIYATKISGVLGKISRPNVIVPAISWATTVSPFIQFGFNPILCDVDTDLNINIEKLHNLNIKSPSIVMIVHVLGTACKMAEIQAFCKKHDAILLEDDCEGVGSTYKGVKTGNFGLMSTFSFYYGHHVSTIEGGMICTNDKKMYELLLMLRSHGWDRDLSLSTQNRLRKKYNINDFHTRFTMYEPSFNVRSTDLQAYLGLRQLKKINCIIKKRQDNLKLYDRYLNNKYWKLPIDENEVVSNFAYPVIHPKIKSISKALHRARIDHRPLLCGNINRQPFYKKHVGECIDLEMADLVHDFGLYLPNNPELKESDIKRICTVINKIIEK